MVTFDAEDDSKGNIFLMGFFNGKKYTSFETKDYKTPDAFRQSVINYIINSNEKMFVAHNLEYDLAHIFQGDFLTCLDWYYSAGLIYCKFVNANIKFLDSFHFSYCSLKELGKQINHGKKEIDIQNIYELYKQSPELVKDYNRTDCEVIHKYIAQFSETIENEFDIKIKNTLAGTSQAIFLKHFIDYEIAGINYNPELLNAYYGGRVECFFTGEINKTIYEMDFNSMYPSVMMNKFPSGGFFKSEKPISEYYIARVKVIVNENSYIPVLPYRSGKLLFPVGCFETWATNIEIDAAQKENQIAGLDYREVYNFPDTQSVFKKFIEYFYSRRQLAKDRKDKFESEYYKRVMNHLYGRFALHKELKKLTRITEKNSDTIIPINNIAGYEKIATSDKSKNFALAIYVTSYARVKLHWLLSGLNKKYDILYCDTDSCYFTARKNAGIMEVITDINKNFNISNELGALSLNAYESGAFYNSKAYILNKFSDSKKIKLKGIKAEYREEFLKTGKTKYRKPVRMRTALRSVQGLNTNSWEYQEISRRGLYDKRELIPVTDKLNKTKPLKMGD